MFKNAPLAMRWFLSVGPAQAGKIFHMENHGLCKFFMEKSTQLHHVYKTMTMQVARVYF